MLLPRLLLNNFIEDEQSIIKPLLNHKNRFYSVKPAKLSNQSEFIYLAIIKHLYRDIRFMIPCISLNDQFYNKFLNKSIPEVNEMICPWNVPSLTLLCAKILGEIDGGYESEVLKHIQDQLQKP